MVRAQTFQLSGDNLKEDMKHLILDLEEKTKGKLEREAYPERTVYLSLNTEKG